MKITNLLIDSRYQPIGSDEAKPIFSWQLTDALADTFQIAYQLIVRQGQSIVWDSGRVTSSSSLGIQYSGDQLAPKTRYQVAVTVWANHKQSAQATSFFETGLLGSSFKANWITHDFDSTDPISPVLIKSFSLASSAQARLYVTALGLYEIALDDQPITQDRLTPGWTNYHKRLQYQTYPLTLEAGQHTLKVTLANGWYKGELGFMPQPNNYGDRTALLLELDTEQQGHLQPLLGSDTSWQVTTGPVQAAEFYNGQTTDWTAKARAPRAALILDPAPKTHLVGQENEPVRVVQELPVSELLTTPKKELVLDFAQNIAGFVRWQNKLPVGHKVTLQYAESLDENGNFYMGNLSYAKATDVLVGDGKTRSFEPHFTFHGFRYLKITGLDLTDIHPDDFTACALSSKLTITGSFSTTNKEINQLQSNIQWSQRDNFIDIPTDCPQRSERLGWTGDVAAFASTAVMNLKSDVFFRKWLHDLSSEQNNKIGVPQIVPDIIHQQATAFWGDVATILPWELYQAYGNKQVLEEQYSSMTGWVDWIEKQTSANHLWQEGYQYGDWLALDAELQGLTDERNGATDRYLIANACYLHSLDLVIKTAKILGKEHDFFEYQLRYQQVLAAFQQEYFTATGRLVSETQTACVLVLTFKLAPTEFEQRILTTLVTNLGAHKNHITTGFVGTPFICHVLSEHGHHDLAARIVLNSDCPSWLYEVGMGATTIWERWDSILPDHSFNPKNMNSLNHYAYGSIGSWLYKQVAGITPLVPGYRRFKVAPKLTKGFPTVHYKLLSPYGAIKLDLICKDQHITLDLEVPANTEAELTLPEQNKTLKLGSGHYHYDIPTTLSLEIGKYTYDTKVSTILSNKIARQIIQAQAPEILTNNMIVYIENSPVSEIFGYSPQAKPLFDAVLAAMNQAEPV